MLLRLHIPFVYVLDISNLLCSRSSVGAKAPRAAEPTAPTGDNVAVGSHTQYVPTLTAATAC